MEEGEPPLQAAFKGAGQIGFTIVSLTVSLVAVFIPLLFMGGVVGRLFNEFAVTLVGGGNRFGRGVIDVDADDVRAAAAPEGPQDQPGPRGCAVYARAGVLPAHADLSRCGIMASFC